MEENPRYEGQNWYSANIVKKKINDPNSFIVKETEAVKKADELDLEGACKRKTKSRGMEEGWFWSRYHTGQR